ncbi:uncharacterized protein LOC115626855 [Scaptodrosophila lebanonensis]|uniref:Uncharacterized protein LOC115626855 n=1 Tax=Drosophila lebanonensis TaxID=7225 RepID=A0A6J2TNM7_DROLE|nr:uncharacterized protein LOC115626855 [Scaptodrosophila lebanonensis]
MSTDEDSVGSPLKPATPTGERPGGKNRNASEILRHQQSFEARYSSIIQKQIWDTSINKDVLERQLNAYFPFARSASLSKDGSGGFDQLLTPTAATSKTRSVSTTPTKKRPPGLDKLDKLETVDVAEKEAMAKSLE